MIHVAKNVVVPYSCEQMFCIVEEIERYPEFLPWCERGEVLVRAPHTANLSTIPAVSTTVSAPPPPGAQENLAMRAHYRRIGRVFIKQWALRAQFTTENECIAPYLLTVRQAQGKWAQDDPFAEIGGEWRFKPLGDLGCKVSVEMNYRFKNAVLEKLLGRLFAGIIDNFAQAFVRRAHHLYVNDPNTTRSPTKPDAKPDDHR